MFNYSQVRIERSETTVISLAVPPWEVAVLAAVHGGDITSVTGEVPVRRDPPEAMAEYERLALRYGKDEENGQEFVAMVYGVGARGVKALEAEIAKATVTAEQAPPPDASAPAPSALTTAEDPDPLEGLDFDDSPTPIDE